MGAIVIKADNKRSKILKELAEKLGDKFDYPLVIGI